MWVGIGRPGFAEWGLETLERESHDTWSTPTPLSLSDFFFLLQNTVGDVNYEACGTHLSTVVTTLFEWLYAGGWFCALCI